VVKGRQLLLLFAAQLGLHDDDDDDDDDGGSGGGGGDVSPRGP